MSAPPACLLAVLACAGALSAAPPNVAVTKSGGAVEGGGIALDPRAPGRLATVYWDDRPDRRGTCSIALSSNEGATWTSHALPALPPGATLCRNAVVAFGPDRTLYVAYEAAQLSGFAQVELARSTDGGATFGDPVLLDPDATGGGDREPSVVAGKGRVVVSFQRYDEDEERAVVEVVTSSDGGESFSAPVAVSPPAQNAAGSRAALALDPVGRLYAAWVDGSAVDLAGGGGTARIVVASSNASAAAAWAVGDVFFAARSDSAAPRAPMVRGALVVRQGRAAIYRLSATDAFTPAAALRFRCGVDAAPLRPCAARLALRLPPGLHVLRVRAVDAAGNRSALTRLTVHSVAAKAR